MRNKYKSEKQAREETIGRAVAMAEVAIREKRAFTPREARKVELFLSVAESLKLCKAFPREPQALVDAAAKKAK